MVDGSENEYLQAKERAIQKLGLSTTSYLPSNRKIKNCIARLTKDQLGPDEVKRRIQEMREIAEQIMAVIDDFDPYLIGSTLTGKIRDTSDIDLHAYSDDWEEIQELLTNWGLRRYRRRDCREFERNLCSPEVVRTSISCRGHHLSVELARCRDAFIRHRKTNSTRRFAGSSKPAQEDEEGTMSSSQKAKNTLKLIVILLCGAASSLFPASAQTVIPAETGWEQHCPSLINRPSDADDAMRARIQEFRKSLQESREERKNLNLPGHQFGPNFGGRLLPLSEVDLLSPEPTASGEARAPTPFLGKIHFGYPQSTANDSSRTNGICILTYANYLWELKERPLTEMPGNAKIVRLVWFRKSECVLCLRFNGKFGDTPASMQGKRLQSVRTINRSQGLDVGPRVTLNRSQFEKIFNQINDANFWITEGETGPNIDLISSWCNAHDQFSIPRVDRLVVEIWSDSRHRLAVPSIEKQSSIKEFLAKQLETAGVSLDHDNINSNTNAPAFRPLEILKTPGN